MRRRTTQLRAGSPQQAGMLPAQVERARGLLGGWVASGYSPAISVLVARRGVVVLHEAFGVLGPDAGAPPLETHHLFPVMSVTKMLTGTVAMGLVEDGLIGLNRPVVDYLPEFTGGGKDDALVHHLLTHTWGEGTENIFAGAAKGPPSAAPTSPSTAEHPRIHHLVQAALAAPLAAPPGTLMEYGIFGYLLLAEIAERVSGQSLAELAKQRIFEPLGMKDSWLELPESESARVVRRPDDAPFAGPGLAGAGLNSRQSEETPLAAGGLYTTTGDLGILLQTFLNGGSYGATRMLSRATVEAMMRNQIPGVPFAFGSTRGEASMGYGWFVESPTKWRPLGSLQSLGSVNHQGIGASVVWIDPPRELVGVYCEVLLDMDMTSFEPRWNFDLFQNAITAAIDE